MDPNINMNFRAKTVIQAIQGLKNDEIPVIGNIYQPISTATTLFVDPMKLFKC